jgi:hypothetical protein
VEDLLPCRAQANDLLQVVHSSSLYPLERQQPTQMVDHIENSILQKGRFLHCTSSISWPPLLSDPNYAVET